MNAKKSLLFLFLIVSSTAYSQKENKIYGAHIGYKSGFGFIVPHKKNIRHLVTGHSYSHEINLEQQTDGSKEYHHTYNFPTRGVSFSATNTNSEILGNIYSLFPYFGFTNILKPNFHLRTKLFAGFAYFTNPFDLEKNQKNNAIGSHLNLYAGLGLEAKKSFNRLSITSTISFNHVSNTAFKMPNLGINSIQGQLGVIYEIQKSSKTYKRDTISKNFSKKPFYQVIFLVGNKQIHPISNTNYITYSGTFSINRNISNKTILGLGLDIFQNTSHFVDAEKISTKPVNTFDITKIGLSGIYEIPLNNSAIVIAAGFYVRNKFNINGGKIYQRLGFKQYLKDKIILQASFVSHTYIADHIEFGMGYKIGK